jgi:hypothetical protein
MPPTVGNMWSLHLRGASGTFSGGNADWGASDAFGGIDCEVSSRDMDRRASLSFDDSALSFDRRPE